MQQFAAHYYCTTVQQKEQFRRTMLVSLVNCNEIIIHKIWYRMRLKVRL